MAEGLALLMIAIGGAAVLTVGRRRVARREAVQARLDVDRPAVAGPASRDRVFVHRWYFLPWLLGLSVSGVLLAMFGWPFPYAVAPGVLIGLLGAELDRMRVAWKTALIETQLAAAIDLMVSTLQAGGGAMAALDNAAREARAPLRPQLEDLVGRIRLGDDPQLALAALRRRVPLENFRLFASALSVHWEVGGSLAGTLATVGRAVRDRIELGRRVQSITAQTRVSIVAVLGGTYFLALLIWRSNPIQMEGFVRSVVGSYLIAAAILMQALGIVWAASLSRPKV